MVERQFNQKFQETLTALDFAGIGTANQTSINGQFVKVGTKTVLAGQQIAFGQNVALGGTNVFGAPIYVRIDNESGTQIHGKFRLVYLNPQETKKIVIYSQSSHRLDDASGGSVDTSPVIPEYPIRVPEDGKLILEFDSAGVAGTTQTLDFDGTNTRLSIPVTIYQ